MVDKQLTLQLLTEYLFCEGDDDAEGVRDALKNASLLDASGSAGPELNKALRRLSELIPSLRAARRDLPTTTTGHTVKFSVGGHRGYLVLAFYEDGFLGKITLFTNKMGTTFRGFGEVICEILTVALQYGVPLEELIGCLVGSRFEPMGATNNPDIPLALSFCDFIGKYLLRNVLGTEPWEECRICKHNYPAPPEAAKETCTCLQGLGMAGKPILQPCSSFEPRKYGPPAVEEE